MEAAPPGRGHIKWAYDRGQTYAVHQGVVFLALSLGDSVEGVIY